MLMEIFSRNMHYKPINDTSLINPTRKMLVPASLKSIAQQKKKNLLFVQAMYQITIKCKANNKKNSHQILHLNV